jgi:hypothetical protein
MMNKRIQFPLKDKILNHDLITNAKLLLQKVFTKTKIKYFINNCAISNFI